MSDTFRHISVERRGDIFCIHPLRGRMDDSDIRALSDEVESLILHQDCRKLVVSLAGVQCLYSLLLARLIKLRRTIIERGGALKLCDLTAESASVFEACQLHHYFSIVPNEASAIAAFQTSSHSPAQERS